MIHAEVHSDDHVWTASFDATPFFEQVSLQDLQDLAHCDWGGDYPADAVAEFMDEKDPGVTEVFKYKDKKEAQGFECNIREHSAFVWVKANRSDWVAKIWPTPKDYPLEREALLPETKLYDFLHG